MTKACCIICLQTRAKELNHRMSTVEAFKEAQKQVQVDEEELLIRANRYYCKEHLR
jgi:hypothetical protein